MKATIAAALMASYLASGDIKNAEWLQQEEGQKPGQTRPRKGFRCKDIDPDRHEVCKARHMTNSRTVAGITGKEARKAAKRAMKARKQAEGK